MPLFSPAAVFRGVESITPEYLAAHGIRALLLDVDNTLTAHGSQELAPSVEQWLARMREAGVRLVVTSNNVNKRVRPFADRIGVPYCAMCCKPLPGGLARARRIAGVRKSEIALVGDQVFTDALGGNLYGIPVLLVLPRCSDTNLGIRLRRHLEKPVLAHYYKKGGTLQ